MITLRKDESTRYLWLEFDERPDEATRTLLYAQGWRWGSYRKQYYNNRRFAKVPEGLAYEDGGTCTYASERSGRLAVASDNATERAENAVERSNDLANSLGGVAVLGTRGRQGKVLSQSEKAKDAAERDLEYARDLERQSRGSASHQAYIERPEVIHRRIKRLKADIMSIKNQHSSWLRSRLYDLRDEQDEQKKAEMVQAMKDHKQEAAARIALIEQEIAEYQAKLDARGGIMADRVNVEVGDIIYWRGERKKVLKINKVSYQVEAYPSREGYWGRSHKIDKSELQLLLQKADGTIVNEEPARRGYQAPQEVEKPTFAVDAVQSVNIGNASHTSFFPTPPEVLEQLPMFLIPDGARVLEPSAGTGAIVDALNAFCPTATVECCEIVYDLQEVLTKKGYAVVGSDFLEYAPNYQYDAVVMNPPFSGLTWLDHIEHALSLLKPGGILIAIVPAGFAFRSESRVQAFRDMVETRGEWSNLSEEAFKISGTSVRTVILSLTKP